MASGPRSQKIYPLLPFGMSSGPRSKKISPFLPFVCVDAVLDVIIQCWQFKRGGVSFTEVISFCYHIQYLCWYSFLVESVSSSKDVV